MPDKNTNANAKEKELMKETPVVRCIWAVFCTHLQGEDCSADGADESGAVTCCCCWSGESFG